MCFCYPPHGYAAGDGKHPNYFPMLFLDSDAVTSVSMMFRPKPRKYHGVCSRQFKPEEIDVCDSLTNLRKACGIKNVFRLKEGAIPTINVEQQNGSVGLQQKRSCRS